MVNKTYLNRILEILIIDPHKSMPWDILCSSIIDNWDDSKAFDHGQLIKNGIIRGIKLDKIEKIEIGNVKTKYKYHNYKIKLN